MENKPGNEPQSLKKRHSSGLSQLYEASGVEICLMSLQLKWYKRENLFLFFSFLSLVLLKDWLEIIIIICGYIAVGNTPGAISLRKTKPR